MLEWLIFKIIGVLMMAVGGFLVIFFPGIGKHQESGSSKAAGQQTNFGLGGMVIGFVLIVVGGFILFSP